MRTFFAVSLATFLGCSTTTAPHGHVIALAMSESSEMPQPGWVGFARGGNISHVPAAAIVAPLKSGPYIFRHVDFGVSKHRGPSVFFEPYKFYVQRDHIYVFTSLVFSGQDLESIKLVPGDVPGLLRAACDKSPEMMLSKPVLLLRATEKPIRVPEPCGADPFAAILADSSEPAFVMPTKLPEVERDFRGATRNDVDMMLRNTRN